MDCTALDCGCAGECAIIARYGQCSRACFIKGAGAAYFARDCFIYGQIIGQCCVIDYISGEDAVRGRVFIVIEGSAGDCCCARKCAVIAGDCHGAGALFLEGSASVEFI